MDNAVSGWWIPAASAAAALITAAVSAAVYAFRERARLRKEQRVDTIMEWQTVAHVLQADVATLKKESRDQYEKLMEAYRREQDCVVKQARMEGDIRLLEATVRRLQQVTGDTLPSAVAVGILIADIDGKIREVSPSLTPILHYLPAELRGKNAEVLMPERYKERHRAGLAKLRSSPMGPWPERAIVVEALTKEGTEVPVSITLSGWQTPSGDWMISAEFRPRVPDKKEV